MMCYFVDPRGGFIFACQLRGGLNVGSDGVQEHPWSKDQDFGITFEVTSLLLKFVAVLL